MTKIINKYEGQKGQAVCPICGKIVYELQACYSGKKLGDQILHVHCGDAVRNVYVIKAEGFSGPELICDGPRRAADELFELLSEADPGEGYTVTVKEMPNLRFFALPEFEGF